MWENKIMSRKTSMYSMVCRRRGGGGKRKMKTKAKGLKGERKGWKGQSMQRLSLTNITSHPLCHDTPPVSLTRG